MEPPLFLASQSPRRAVLLREAGVAFRVIDTAVTEYTPAGVPHWNAATLAEKNALLKAMPAAGPRYWTLGADTVVTRAGRIFGKPASLAEAREFLMALSGGVHEVITGCALIGPTKIVFHEVTRVVFRALNDETIAQYLAEVPVLDKAGAYGLQDKGELLVERVEGSRANVVGLPIERLLPLLREHGLV